MSQRFSFERKPEEPTVSQSSENNVTDAPANTILQLQQQIGNQATINRIQRKAISSTGRIMIQRVWGTVSGTSQRVNLRTLNGKRSAAGNQLYGQGSDDPVYEWESEDMNGNITVKPYNASKNPLKDEYEGWSTDKTTSQQMTTPFGEASARHSRGAPFAQTNAQDYGGYAVGDSYSQMVYGLRGNSNDASDDPQLASALLQFSTVDLTDEMQKNAASKLTVTVYLAEEWRKQGATKIWRALLRLVEQSRINMLKATQLFQFVQSADAGRQQVGRFQDVYEGHTNQTDLSANERMIYSAMSPIHNDDFSSDDDMRDKKELKSKSRLYAHKHQEESDSGSDSDSNNT